MIRQSDVSTLAAFVIGRLQRQGLLTNPGAPAAAVAWDNVTGKPTVFVPAAHTHTIEQVVGLTDALASAGGGSQPSGGFVIDDGGPSTSGTFILDDGAL